MTQLLFELLKASAGVKVEKQHLSTSGHHFIFFLSSQDSEGGELKTKYEP